MSVRHVSSTLADCINTLVKFLIVTHARNKLLALCLSVCENHTKLLTFRRTLSSSHLSVFLGSDSVVRTGCRTIFFCDAPAGRLLSSVNFLFEFRVPYQLVVVIVVC